MLTKASWHGSAAVKVQSCKMRQLTLGNTGVKKRKHGWWNDFRQVLSWRGLIEVHPAELLLFKPQYVHMSVQSSGKTELCRLRVVHSHPPSTHTRWHSDTHTWHCSCLCTNLGSHSTSQTIKTCVFNKKSVKKSRLWGHLPLLDRGITKVGWSVLTVTHSPLTAQQNDGYCS